MFVFHGIYMKLSILFPGDLLKKLGKFLTTLHSSNSSSDCFHVVLTISCPFLITPSTGSLFTWLSILLYPVFGCDPLSHFIPSIVVSLCSIIAHSIFFPFPSYNIGFVCLSETCHICIMIFWDEEIELTRKSLPFSICFLRNIRSFRSFISIQNQGAFTKLLILFQS